MAWSMSLGLPRALRGGHCSFNQGRDLGAVVVLEERHYHLASLKEETRLGEAWH